MNEWISRGEALAMLGLRSQTLYAYVSRGLVARQSDPADPRRSLYRADDVLALVKRRRRGRGTAAIAASAFAWGEPVIETAISTVRQGRLIYRGLDAARFSENASFEECARLLWDLPQVPEFAASGPPGSPFVVLGEMAAEARPSAGRSHQKLAEDACRAVSRLVTALGADGEGAVHLRLARLWRLDAAGADLIRRALVLLADHELNPSTFAARVAASTGASLPACLLAGMGALSGPRHGGAGIAVAALVAEAERSGADEAVDRWLATGQGLPGFGHALYPSGDPRAAALLDHAPPDPALEALRKAAFEASGRLPNIDFALIALSRRLGLPAQTPLRLFAVGRSLGWAAHAIEQVLSGELIRPRARYVGPANEALDARQANP